jgi:S1-C subfamily serine protease
MVTRQELAKSLVITYDASNSEMNRIKTITAVYPSTCTIKTDKTYGSGVAIAENQILTAYHVIKNNGVIKITMYGDIELIGRVIKISEVFDLALIEVDYKLIPIQFAASVQVGQSSIAFGCPNGLKNTVTCGIVSNVSRNIEGIYQTFIQIDTPINQGNSGGAVVDTQAKLIGIANCKISGNIDGLAFIVPFSSINIFLNDK